MGWPTFIRATARKPVLALHLMTVAIAIVAAGAGEELESVAAPTPTTRPARSLVAARPAPLPAPPEPTATLPPDLSVLNKRSIFSKSGLAAPPKSTKPLSQPEAMFAVRGIVFDDTNFLVFIEDTATHRTVQLRPGDPVAGGKIGQISLDDFAYESGGAVRRVRVGQNLMGTAVPPLVAVAHQPPTTGPATGPPGAPPRTAKPGSGPVFEIGPNGQRIRDYVAERSAGE